MVSVYQSELTPRGYASDLRRFGFAAGAARRASSRARRSLRSKRSGRTSVALGIEGQPTVREAVEISMGGSSRDDDFVQRVPFAEAAARLGRPGVSARDLQRAPVELRPAPGARRSVVLADTLKERCGEAGLTEAINEDRALQARDVLTELIRACRIYAGDMGYLGGNTYYSKVWSEKPWRRALRLAEGFARDEFQLSMDPALVRVVSAIATLVRQSLQFWNGMGESDDGRSLIDAEKCRAWEAQVNAAAPG